MKTLAALLSLCVLFSSEILFAADQKAGPGGDTGVRPLTASEMAGKWKILQLGSAQPEEARLTIRLKDEQSKRLVVEGKYRDWEQEGEVAEGKVTFVRKPKAAEMSDNAPLWARDIVAASGELKWKLELKGEFREKKAFLEGKWYPGEFQWRTAVGANPALPLPGEGQAQYLGPGKPLQVRLEKPVPKFFLYAKCLQGLQPVEELYVGVPTLIEAQFDPEYEDEEDYPIELKNGDQSVQLTARKFDQKGMIFRTDFFIPGAVAQKSSVPKEEVWDPPPPPRKP